MRCPLQIIREINRESRVDIARKFRVNHTTIFRWENNIMMPSAENFIEVAEYLDMDVKECIEMWLQWSKEEKGETMLEYIERED